MRSSLIALIGGVALMAGWTAPVSSAAVEVGEAAPDFTLQDATGQSRSLSEFLGQFIVLEWFNKDCPFSRKHYDSGNMQGLQSTYTAKGVAWLTITSSAPGKQGYLTPRDAAAVVAERQMASTALLLDPDGTVGRLYGAKTTPHMFVIDLGGMLVYAGAIDDRPSANRADLDGATNYVRQALEEAMAGKPISTPSTTSYGCSVKY